MCININGEKRFGFTLLNHVLYGSFEDEIVIIPAVPPNDQIHDTNVENRNCGEDMRDIQKRRVVDDMIVNGEYDERIYE